MAQGQTGRASALGMVPEYPSNIGALPQQRSQSAAGARGMTPVETTEARMQELVRTHQQQLQQLSFARQQIMQRQALWTGNTQLQTPEEKDPQARRAKRLALVEQLTSEQAPAQAMLEALKKGCSLEEARAAGHRLQQQMAAINGNATRTASGAASPAASELGAGGLQNSLLGTADQSKGRPAIVAPSRVPSFTQRDNKDFGPLSKVQFHLKKQGPQDDLQQQQAGVAFPSPPQTSGSQGADATLVEHRKEGEGSGGDEETMSRTMTPESVRSLGDRSAAASPGSRSEAGQPSRHSRPGSNEGQPRPPNHNFQPHSRSSSRAPSDSEPPPPYIEELKQQVKALQDVVASQVANQQHQQFAQHLPPQPMMMPPQPMMMPPMMMPPWYPPPFMPPMQPPQPQPQPPPQPPPPEPPKSPPKKKEDYDLGPLSSDPVLREIQIQHHREMAMLRMEIDCARTATELEGIKSMLNDVKIQTEAKYPAAQLAPPPPPAKTLHHMARSFSYDGEDTGQPAEPPPVAGRQMGSLPTGSEPGSQAPPSLLQQTLDPLPSAGQMVNGSSSDTSSDDDEGRGSFFSEDEDLIDRPPVGKFGEIIRTDALQFLIQSAGPFSVPGQYRVRVILYDGYQPVEAGPDLLVGASTGRRSVDIRKGGMVEFHDNVSLRGLTLTPTMLFVFELYLAKQAVAGMPSKEAMVAWGFISALSQGEVHQGRQAIPLFRLPLIIRAQRKFSYNNAMLEFSVSHADGEPGDATTAHGKQGAAEPQAARRSGGPAGPSGRSHEDVPGVPCTAWVRVSRGTPPAEPFTPGEGFVVLLDGARFLPASATLTRVMGQAYSSDRQPLGTSFEAFSTPGSIAYSPYFGTQATLAVGGDKFDNPTATLLFTVQTVERWSRQLRVVGFACLPVFVDSKTSQQPLSKNVRDYVLNKGAFQIPIHTSLSPATAPFRGDSLESSVPRVPCASLLVRILSPETAKQQRRQPQPVYTDRVYDSTRAQPSPVERKLYPKYLARKPLLVREAARIITAASLQVQARVVQTVRAAQAQQREAAFQGSTSTGSVIAPSPPPPPLMTQQQSSATGPQNGAFRQSVAAAVPAATTAAAAAAPSLPNNDEELLDWIESHIRRLIAQQKGGNVALNYNFASEYFPDLGFFVAIDGAMRIPRNLPSAALTTFAPPGSFYQDNPVVDDLKATLEYDMTSYLSEPRWTDGLQLFLGVGYETGLCVLVDVRLLVPATGSSAPAGWSVLPVFERGEPFVASGAYHLPLFKGVPSWHLIREFQSKGDVDKVIEQQYTLGKLKLHEEYSSVLVRVVEYSQAGIQGRPATAVPLGKLRLPQYARVLPPKHMAAMQKEMRNKTYTQAKPPDVTADSWVESMNDCIIKVAGLELVRDSEDDSSEEGDDERRFLPSPKRPMAAAAAAAAAGGGRGRGRGTPPLHPAHTPQHAPSPPGAPQGKAGAASPPAAAGVAQQQPRPPPLPPPAGGRGGGSMQSMSRSVGPGSGGGIGRGQGMHQSSLAGGNGSSVQQRGSVQGGGSQSKRIPQGQMLSPDGVPMQGGPSRTNLAGQMVSPNLAPGQMVPPRVNMAGQMMSPSLASGQGPIPKPPQWQQQQQQQQQLPQLQPQQQLMSPGVPMRVPPMQQPQPQISPHPSMQRLPMQVPMQQPQPQVSPHPSMQRPPMQVPMQQQQQQPFMQAPSAQPSLNGVGMQSQLQRQQTFMQPPSAQLSLQGSSMQAPQQQPFIQAPSAQPSLNGGGMQPQLQQQQPFMQPPSAQPSLQGPSVQPQLQQQQQPFVRAPSAQPSLYGGGMQPQLQQQQQQQPFMQAPSAQPSLQGPSMQPQLQQQQQPFVRAPSAQPSLYGGGMQLQQQQLPPAMVPP